MSAPIGNQNALGNRGGGRKSAYDEYKDARWLSEAWSSPIFIEELKNKIEVERCYSPQEMFLWKALNGDAAILKCFVATIFSQKAEQDDLREITQEEVEETIKRLIKIEEEERARSSS